MNKHFSNHKTTGKGVEQIDHESEMLVCDMVLQTFKDITDDETEYNETYSGQHSKAPSLGPAGPRGGAARA